MGLAVGAAIVLVAAVGFAVINTSLADVERVRTSSDLSEGEVVSIANALLAQWAADQETLRAQRPSVSLSEARVVAETRLEKLENDYWEALQGIRPGLDEEMLGIVERLPVVPVSRWDEDQIPMHP